MMKRGSATTTTSEPTTAPSWTCLQVQTTWAYLTYLQYLKFSDYLVVSVKNTKPFRDLHTRRWAYLRFWGVVCAKTILLVRVQYCPPLFSIRCLLDKRKGAVGRVFYGMYSTHLNRRSRSLPSSTRINLSVRLSIRPSVRPPSICLFVCTGQQIRREMAQAQQIP